MRQFDVVPNPSNSSRSYAPYVLVLQSHYVELDTTVVAPIARDKTPSDLEVAVEIRGESLVVALTELAAVRTASLRGTVSSLRDFEDEIRRALERLFTGF
jgi:toxin CcdB